MAKRNNTSQRNLKVKEVSPVVTKISKKSPETSQRNLIPTKQSSPKSRQSNYNLRVSQGGSAKGSRYEVEKERQ